MELCVSVSILQGSGEVVSALWLSVKSSIVPFKTKELLCVQTQQAVASHSAELCWNHSNSPLINAVTLLHTHIETHMHIQTVSLSFCLSPPHSCTQTNREPSSQGMESHATPLSKSRHFGLPQPGGRRMAQRRKRACHSMGVKLFLCYGLGWPCEDIDSLLCQERELCWQISHWHPPHLVLNPNSPALPPSDTCTYLVKESRGKTYSQHPAGGQENFNHIIYPCSFFLT